MRPATSGGTICRGGAEAEAGARRARDRGRAMSIALLLLPDFLLIALGAALKRLRGFDAAFWSGVERLVYFVLFPALLFRSLATSPLALADAGPFARGRPRLHAWRHGALGARAAAVPAAARDLRRVLPVRLPLQHLHRARRRRPSLGGEAALAPISLLIGVLVPVVNVAAVGDARARSAARASRSSSRATRWCSPAPPGSCWHAAALPLPAIAGASLESPRERRAAARSARGRCRPDALRAPRCRPRQQRGGTASSCSRCRHSPSRLRSSPRCRRRSGGRGRDGRRCRPRRRPTSSRPR